MIALTNSRAEIDSLADQIAEVSAHSAVLEHQRLTYIRRFDELSGWGHQGARSCAHWLTWRIGMAPGAAREQVRVARALGKLPRIDAALARGDLSYSKVRALTRVATAENEGLLVEMALHATAAQLERICRNYQTVAHGSGDEDLAPAHERRSFDRRDLDSGLVRFTIQVRPEEAAVVVKAIETAIAAACSAKDVSAETPRRVDAFMAICESFEAPKKPVRAPHEVQIHVDAATLEGEVEDGAPLSPETVKRLLCSAAIVPNREYRGATLDVGRRRRTIPASLERALRRRDRGCRFPGCTNRLWVDGHHVQHWARGGETKLDNLVLLCRFHHRAVHEGGFTVAATKNGFVFRNPFGVVVEAWPLEVVPDASDRLAVARRVHGITPRTGFPLWDGRPVNYDHAIQALCEIDEPPTRERFVDEDPPPPRAAV